MRIYLLKGISLFFYKTGCYMKSVLMKAVIGAAFSALTLPALAAGSAGSGPNPYSDCGIGAAIFKDTEWAAATSNVIWDLGTTAVTSATVSPETCSKKNVKAAMLIRDSYALVTEDAARGQGAHMSAALEIMGCAAGPSRAAAAGEVRESFSRVLNASGYNDQKQIEKAGQMYNMIESAARNHCSV